MEISLWVSANPIRNILPSSFSWSNSRPAFTQRITCRASSLPSQQEVTSAGILCDPCKGKGWVVCDFCEGQKINVQAQSKRFYRRCPSCRAFTRQTKSLSGTIMGVEAGPMASGAQTGDWNDAEAGNFSFPFAIDYRYGGKFFNSDIFMDEVLDSFTSRQNRQTSEAMEFQYSSGAAIGAIVQLLKFAPPLQQSTTLGNSDGFSKSSKLPSQKSTDGNIFFCPHKLDTSGLLRKQSFVIPNCQQEGATSSHSEKTAGEALKELDRYKEIKNQILSKGKNNTTED